MHVTVTGGAGFIGSAVVRAALAAGHEVAVIDDLSTGSAEALDQTRVRLVVGDVRDAGLLDDILVATDAVFHLAAQVGNVRSIEDPRGDADRNIRGTIGLLEAMKRHGVRRLVYSSSAAVYGEPVTLPIDEGHPCRPDSPYGVSKLAAEAYCLCYGRLYGWSVACLRYFNVYGEGQRFDPYGNVIPIFATRLLRGEPLTVYGDGHQTRDFVHVRDVARANLLALASGTSGTFNVASGRSCTIEWLANEMVRLSGGASGITFAPPRPGEVRASEAEIGRARRDLGYSPQEEILAGLTE
jgi:UDP-glucose 4-epimerase